MEKVRAWVAEPSATPWLVGVLVAQVGQVTVLVERDSGELKVELIPARVKVVQTHGETLEVGAPNNMSWFAPGTALGDWPYHDVVMVEGDIQPQELATTPPPVALAVRVRVPCAAPAETRPVALSTPAEIVTALLEVQVPEPESLRTWPAEPLGTQPEPPPPVELIVWLGHEPVMVTLVPATSPGVAVPVPPLAMGRIPETPVVSARPVALVRVMVGAVPKTKAPVPVSSVTQAARLALEGVPKNVAQPVPKPETPVEIGRPVALVKVTLAGMPSTGAIKVGPLLKTARPVPVSSLSTPANWALVVAAKTLRLLAVRASVPEASGAVRTLAAVGVPVSSMEVVP